jgi:hypothetical protein
MANNFSKEERVAFENILEGFNDALVISRNVATFGTDGSLMERANDTIWRPMPYILSSQTRTIGTPVTAQDANQLAVPSRLNIRRSVPWNMNALELRDQLQEGRLGQAAYQRLASDVNTAVRDVASDQGTLVATVVGAAGTYEHIARAENLMNEQGIPEGDRYLALTTRDYNGLAGNLAGRQDLGASKALTAYERSRVGLVAGFETYKIDAGRRIAGVTATPTIATNGAQVRYAPTSTDVNGNNVDNRTQVVTVSSVAGITPGAAFQIAGIESVHHITKEATGQLKTFRVISTPSTEPTLGAAEIRISPPIIGANSAPTAAEVQYKNVEVVSTSATANITFMNNATTGANPFWHKDSIELLPGRYAVPADQGVDVMRGTIDQGLEVVMSKRFDNSTFTSLYTLDILFGVVNTNPQMNGVILFNQS